jgi:cell division protein FtsB
MRWISLVLVFLLVLLQYQLWLGKIETQKNSNRKTQARNAMLDAEVRDLKQGTEAIEERARSELGMVKGDEVFFQIVSDHQLVPTSAVRDAKASNINP